MRKKQLLQLNHELFNNLEKTKAAYEELKEENEQLRAKIKELFDKEENLETPTEIIEEQVIFTENQPETTVSFNEDTEYGATAIGKIVISATKCCNRLSSQENGNTKELINLILGRTEVAKAEILKIVSSDDEIETKKMLIDKECASAQDYFNSVMAQY